MSPTRALALFALFMALCAPSGIAQQETATSIAGVPVDLVDVQGCLTGSEGEVLTCTSGQVDLQPAGGGGGSSISAGDSSVEVIDAGAGQVDIDIDGENLVTWDAASLLSINEPGAGTDTWNLDLDGTFANFNLVGANFRWQIGGETLAILANDATDSSFKLIGDTGQTGPILVVEETGGDQLTLTHNGTSGVVKSGTGNLSLQTLTYSFFVEESSGRFGRAGHGFLTDKTNRKVSVGPTANAATHGLYVENTGQWWGLKVSDLSALRLRQEGGAAHVEIRGLIATSDFAVVDHVITAADAQAAASTNQDGADIVLEPGANASGGGTDGTVTVRQADSTGELTFQHDGTDGIIDTSTGGVVVKAPLATDTQSTTLGAAATVIAITDNLVIVTGDGGANTVATITGGVSGMVLRLLFVDALVTITDDNTHGADSVDLSAAFTSADDTVLTLLYDGTSWYQTAPASVN